MKKIRYVNKVIIRLINKIKSNNKLFIMYIYIFLNFNKKYNKIIKGGCRKSAIFRLRLESKIRDALSHIYLE